MGGLHKNVDLLQKAVGHVHFLHDTVGVHGLVEDEDGALPHAAHHPGVDVAHDAVPFQFHLIAPGAPDQVHFFPQQTGKRGKSGVEGLVQRKPQVGKDGPGGCSG